MRTLTSATITIAIPASLSVSLSFVLFLLEPTNVLLKSGLAVIFGIDGKKLFALSNAGLCLLVSVTYGDGGVKPLHERPKVLNCTALVTINMLILRRALGFLFLDLFLSCQLRIPRK